MNELGNPGTAGYSVIGTGDYDGNGTSDLLLENPTQNVIDWRYRTAPSPTGTLSETHQGMRSAGPNAASASRHVSQRGRRARTISPANRDCDSAPLELRARVASSALKLPYAPTLV
jgi:hypothetical protein